MVAVMLLGAACTPRERTACNDTVSALVTIEKRCGNNTPDDTLRTAVENSLTAGMTCAAVVRIRDENVLRGQCFPALLTLSCADYQAARLPDSCRDQIRIVGQSSDGGDNDSSADGGEAGSPDASATDGGMDASVEASAPDAAPMEASAPDASAMDSSPADASSPEASASDTSASADGAPEAG